MSDTSESLQIPLNSKDDIVAELILELKHDVKIFGRYDKVTDCRICLDSLHNQYVFQYPCSQQHTLHRNCALTNVLNYKKNSCPVCEIN
jgi:hypothetical protein